MFTVALQQVTSKFARNNAGKTLEKPIALKFVKRYLAPEVFGRLESQCQDGKIFIWGAKLERSHQLQKMLPRRCLVLFRRGGEIYKTGVILEWIVNLELAEYLWGFDTDGETWGLVYFLKSAKDISIAASEINRLIGRMPRDHWQGLVAVSSPAADTVIAFVKSQIEAMRSNSGLQSDAAQAPRA
jgi:hypothetical protein